MSERKRGGAHHDEEEKQQRRDQFKSYRNKLGLSQKVLSQLIGIRDSNISIIETGGKRCTAPTKQQIKHMETISFIHRHGLLDKLLEEINKKS